jgi:histidyl-tRNA synthetase
MTGMASKEVNQAAAGISISLDKIVSALQDENYTPAVDVVVCSVGHQPMLKEKAAVMQELWAAGIKSSLMDSLQVCSSVLLLLCVITGAVLYKLWHVGGDL